MRFIIFLLFPTIMWGQPDQRQLWFQMPDGATVSYHRYKEPRLLQLNKPILIGYGLMFWSGFTSGIQQQTHAHSTWAEDIFHVKPNSWLGSKQWEGCYRADGTHRSEIIGNFGYDSQHTFDRLHTLLAIGGEGYIIGGSWVFLESPKRQMKKFLIHTIIGLCAHTLGANVSYRWIENRR